MSAQVDYPASIDSQNPDHITMPRDQYERMCEELDRSRPGPIDELATSVASQLLADQQPAAGAEQLSKTTAPGAYTFEEGDTLTIGGRRAVWRDHIWHWVPDDD